MNSNVLLLEFMQYLHKNYLGYFKFLHAEKQELYAGIYTLYTLYYFIALVKNFHRVKLLYGQS